MENVECPLCDGSDSSYLWTKRGAHYFRCNSCSLVYENPRLTTAELKEFYSKESYFFQPDGQAHTSGYQNYLNQCTPTLQLEYFDIVEKYSRVRRGNYLDLGCGTGGLLKIASERGWNAVGIEISDWAIDVGRRQGLNIVEGQVQDACFPAGYFDAVSMFDVLEHLPSPRQYVREVLRILKPGGTLMAETPNVDGFFPRYIYRENTDLVKPRAHICLYGPHSSGKLFAEAGFSMVKIKTFPYCRRFTPGYLKSLVTSRLRRGQTPVQLTFNESLRIVCWK